MFQSGAVLANGIGVSSAGLAVPASLRQRTCIVRSEEGDPVFEFDFKKIWLRIKRLPPLFWLNRSGIVPLAVFHDGREVDRGHLEIDREAEVIIPRGFESTFLQIRNQAVKALSASHPYVNDRLTGMVDNGAYRRMAPLCSNPLYGITYLTPTHRCL